MSAFGETEVNKLLVHPQVNFVNVTTLTYDQLVLHFLNDYFPVHFRTNIQKTFLAEYFWHQKKTKKKHVISFATVPMII